MIFCYDSAHIYVIALTFDIEEAFLQININENDSYIRFLRFDNIFFGQPKIVRNRLASVVFGVTCSPFCLKGTVCKHAKHYNFDGEFSKRNFLIVFC